MNGLVVGGCHFQAFWVGSNPFRSIFFFFQIFGAKEKSGKFWGKIVEIWYNRLSVEISYRSPPITDILAEISEILFLALLFESWIYLPLSEIRCLSTMPSFTMKWHFSQFTTRLVSSLLISACLRF